MAMAKPIETFLLETLEPESTVTFDLRQLRQTEDRAPEKPEAVDDDDKDTDGAGVNQPLKAAAAASRTDEDVAAREYSFLLSLGEMVYHFLKNTIDIKRGNLIDELLSKDVLSPPEKQKHFGVGFWRKTDAKVETLLKLLREKSASQFESFLTTLGETGQQSVAEAVLAMLHKVGQTATNPLHYACVGQVVHTLPRGKPVYGVTSLGDLVYVAREKGGKVEVEMYDVIAFILQYSVTVPNARGVFDMAACEHFLCLYIADHNENSMHRLDVEGGASNATQWPVNDEPTGLSITAAHNLLVTCRRVRKVKEFSSRGDLVREVTLPGDVINPWHTIQLLSGELVVCHGSARISGDIEHRVVATSADGKQLLRSNGGQTGSHADQYDVPFHLAVDDNEMVFAVDAFNRRVKLLSPTLNYIRQVASPGQFRWLPRRLCLDVVRRRLYVGESDLDGSEGRVVVFSL